MKNILFKIALFLNFIFKLSVSSSIVNDLKKEAALHGNGKHRNIELPFFSANPTVPPPQLVQAVPGVVPLQPVGYYQQTMITYQPPLTMATLSTTPSPAFPFNLFGPPATVQAQPQPIVYQQAGITDQPPLTMATPPTPAPQGFPFNLFGTTTTQLPPPFPFNLFQRTTTPRPFPLNLIFRREPRPFPLNLLFSSEEKFG
jgi:hypothetical protein